MNARESTPNFKVVFDQNGNAMSVEDLQGRSYDEAASLFPAEFTGTIVNVTSTSVVVTEDAEFGYCRWVHRPDCRWIKICF